MKKSVLFVCDPAWSTGSMARDIGAVLAPRWNYTLADWANPMPETDAFDVVCCMTITCAARIPALLHARNAVHTLLHPNEMALPDVRALVQRRAGFVLGGVSTECVRLAKRAFPYLDVSLAQVAARIGRFQRRLSPVRHIKRVGFVGFPAAEAVEVTGDSKRPGMFLSICEAASVEPVFSGKAYTYANMQAFYDSIDALVCTSSVDGGPMPPFEAIACGIPAFSTDVGCVRDAALPGRFSTVAECADLLMRSEDTLVSLAARQYQTLVNGWNWESIASDWERLFNRVAVG